MYGSFQSKFPNAKNKEVAFTTGAPIKIKIFPIASTGNVLHFGNNLFFYLSLESDVPIEITPTFIKGRKASDFEKPIKELSMEDLF